MSDDSAAAPAPPRPPLWLGASWYPEMWPEDQWADDLAKMQSLGFNVVRVFEFAWHRFEPREGAYDFAWARRVLDACHAHGIGVILGTPTAAPPRWLTRRYPEVLKTKPEGTRRIHGQRKHGSPCSERYLALCRGIVEQMCHVLADHPAVAAWQIDNEMAGADYGPEARAAFHRWLAERYGSIEQLNQRWGLAFWSQAYDDFYGIELVTAAVGSIEVPERHHPSLITAVGRFQNDVWTAFIENQTRVIRQYSDRPITSNMTGLVSGMNWDQHFGSLDVAGASMYADRRYYHYNLPRFDRLRAQKQGRPYWLLETAPNWSGGGRTFNIHYDARGVWLFSWLSVLMGGDTVLYWQWREHWAGQEMLHGTCVTASGKWRPNRDTWRALGDAFSAHGRWLAEHPPSPARLALFMSAEAAAAFSIDPTDQDMRYETLFRDQVYLPLQQAQLWRDVIGDTADLTPYRVICMPFQPFVRETQRTQLKAWVESGGTLILGPLSCFRTEEFTVPRPQEFGGYEELIGGTSALRFTVQWVEDRVEVCFDRFGSTRTRTLCEAYEPGDGARVIARYRGGYGDGLPAALEHRLGRGRVITLGCMVDEPTWVWLVAGVCREAGIEPLASVEPSDARVVVVPRGGGDRPAGFGVANLEEREVVVQLPRRGVDRLSGERCAAAVMLPPFAVRLIESED